MLSFFTDFILDKAAELKLKLDDNCGKPRTGYF